MAKKLLIIRVSSCRYPHKYVAGWWWFPDVLHYHAGDIGLLWMIMDVESLQCRHLQTNGWYLYSQWKRTFNLQRDMGFLNGAVSSYLCQWSCAKLSNTGLSLIVLGLWIIALFLMKNARMVSVGRKFHLHQRNSMLINIMLWHITLFSKCFAYENHLNFPKPWVTDPDPRWFWSWQMVLRVICKRPRVKTIRYFQMGSFAYYSQDLWQTWHDPGSGLVAKVHRENWMKSMCIPFGEECTAPSN